MEFGATLRRLRSKRGLSLSALGRLAGYSKPYIADLETGRRRPHPDLAERLDRALDAGGQLVALLTQPTPPVPQLPCWGDAVTTPARPTPGVVDLLAESLRVQRGLEDAAGAQAVLLPALGQISSVEAMRTAASGDLHTRLLGLESQWAQFAGWLHQDLDDRAAAAQWYARALELATEAGDAGMVASVLSMRSNMAWSAGDGRRAVQLAEASCRQPATPGVLAMGTQQLARGLAMLGDRAGAERAILRTEELTHQASRARDAEPPWLYFADDARLLVQRATTHRELGDHQRALGLFEEGLSLLPETFVRDRAQYETRMALTLAFAGEAEGAAELAARARLVAVETGSSRTLADLERVDEVLGQRGADLIG